MVQDELRITDYNKLKTMKLKLIAFCLFFITVIFSCKKEDLSTGINPGNTGTATAPQLSKVLVDNQSYYEYLYNDSSLITTEKSKFDYTVNHFNALGQLSYTDYYGNDDVLSSDATVVQTAMNSSTWVTPANGVDGGCLKYEYNSYGQLTKATYSRPQSSSSEYSVFSYDASNRINKQTMYWENIATGYIDYSYDGKGNLILESLYNLPSTGAAELITTTQYDFDSKLNPYKLFSKSLIPGIDTNQNNILKVTCTIKINPAQGSDKVQITQDTYTYNSAGYPVTKNANTTFIYK
jgi:hypothetical protein